MVLIGSPDHLRTQIAPTKRISGPALSLQIAACLENPMTTAILDAIEGYALILNEHRQILAANGSLVLDLALQDAIGIEGQRPGEMVRCIHAHEGPNGCGTSKACSNCGMAQVILAAQSQGRPVERECLLATHLHGKWESHEFQVRATPLRLSDHVFVVLVLRDISAQKRREALEKIFLHDVMNTLQGLQGWTEMLRLPNVKSTVPAQHILELSERLNQEVISQRLLLQAEHGELGAENLELPVARILEDLESALLQHPTRKERDLEIRPAEPNLWIRSDPRLVHRILLNMGVNALEATPPGGKVIVQAVGGTDGCEFSVQNPGCIPEAVASRIFLRSFSTKGQKGRGLGTYSMKLLGENVLGGQVGFRSTPEEGTRFYLSLPENTQ